LTAGRVINSRDKPRMILGGMGGQRYQKGGVGSSEKLTIVKYLKPGMAMQCGTQFLDEAI